jgi:hypothetical protein
MPMAAARIATRSLSAQPQVSFGHTPPIGSASQAPTSTLFLTSFVFVPPRASVAGSRPVPLWLPTRTAPRAPRSRRRHRRRGLLGMRSLVIAIDSSSERTSGSRCTPGERNPGSSRLPTTCRSANLG